MPAEGVIKLLDEGIVYLRLGGVLSLLDRGIVLHAHIPHRVDAVRSFMEVTLSGEG